MKKENTRNLLFVLLIVASIGSYAFLNFAYSANTSKSSAATTEQTLEQEDTRLVLPDVRLIKKVVESGKRFLPAS